MPTVLVAVRVPTHPLVDEIVVAVATVAAGPLVDRILLETTSAADVEEDAVGGPSTVRAPDLA